jgi:hypothetical protein
MQRADSVSAEEIRELLRSRRGEWPAISHGARVSHSWISKFVNGKTDNPGHRTLCELRTFLVGQNASAGSAADQPGGGA